MKIELEQGGAIDIGRIGTHQIAIELPSLQRSSDIRTCPRCGAQPGELCKSRTGRADGSIHSVRTGRVSVEVLTRADAAALIDALKQHLADIEVNAPSSSGRADT